MPRYRLNASLTVAVTQHGKPPREARDHERALASVLTQAVNDLLLGDQALRDRVWQAAGGESDFDGELAFVVNNVAEDA